ncbi:hypothetical protein BABINDRAFT_179946 [Babjeviella inositovora NRRL Y-12698]|uniref:Amino acid permease/ SLC12A domain-containing protein n=1 Tax=Babjeviella inositovora NRRL Y-12698 TaxID=984486 RepID=A0A1E3QSJ0_9ASCO|nr:uncharacterized protein BABINDRAFT_179946 [Babjeviella inositovora NRRL Y-12698]ODQ80659.1 hypothetical protein BABINDRAFT_179946 [Babjeviella inositovora NRRL Y-12698]
MKKNFKPTVEAKKEQLVIDESFSEARKNAIRSANSPLKKSLKTRHLRMIAIGGGIGSGLFVGSGKSLHNGGPAALVIAYSLVGTALFATVHSLGELAVALPVAGSFTTLANRFIDPAWGFAVGWNCCLQWLVNLPLELVTASITIKYWNDTINSDAWVVIFYVILIAINLFGARGYAEAEFIFSSLKVLTISGFCILGIVLNCGGGPTQTFIGGRYWHDPGAFSHGFKGVCSVFVTASFSLGGTEITGVTASETAQPRISFPKATKLIFWKIVIFFVTSLIIVGFLVPYNSDKLMGSGGGATHASPFVIAIENGAVRGLPSVVNTVILFSVLSVGNSAVYAFSRTVCTLAEQGLAPKIFGYIDKSGRPLVGLVAIFIFGLLSFIAASDQQETVFNWLLSLSGLALIFSWLTICMIHIRWRAALKHNGELVENLEFSSGSGIIGSYLAGTFWIVVLILQFWIALWPVGSNTANVISFFQNYLGIIIFIIMYLGYKVVKRDFSLYIKVEDMDIKTGRREVDLELLALEMVEEQARLKALPVWKKIFNFWCN